VHALAVRRDCAGRGIGAQLLNWAEDQARDRDAAPCGSIAQRTPRLS
jgi:GNAT superfamily N-acetyltransferase